MIAHLVRTLVRGYYLDIFERIDFACNMGDIVCSKGSYEMGNCMGFAYMCEKLITEAFPRRCPFHESGDVDELYDSGDNSLRLYYIR